MTGRPTRHWFGSYHLVALFAVVIIILAACADDAPTDDGAAGDDAETDPTEDVTEDDDEPDQVLITGQTPEEIFQQLSEYPRDARDEYIRECAAEEGQVTIYTRSAVEFMEQKVGEFRNVYPDVDAEFIRIEAGQVLDRVRIEHQAGQHLVDVIHVSGLEASLMRNEGYLANFYEIPIPEGYPEAAYGDWYAANDFNPTLVAWNTDLVSDDEVPPASYDELLEPHWHGRIGMRDYAANTIVAMLETRGEDATREFLDGLIAQDAQIRVGSTAGATLLIAGEYAIHGELLSVNFIPSIEEDGAPLDWAHLDPYPAGMTPNHIYAETQNPCASLLWIQHAMSPEGQEYEAQVVGRLVWNPDVPLKYDAYEELRDSAMAGNIMIIDADLVERWDALADELITEIILPHLHPDDR